MILVTETVDILMREALRWLSALSPQEHTVQQVILHGVSWETYERLLVVLQRAMRRTLPMTEVRSVRAWVHQLSVSRE
jgi:hypothetical protein